MGAADLGSNLVKSLSGYTVKAILCIKKPPAPAGAAGAAGGAAAGAAKAAGSAAAGAAGAAAGAAGAAGGMAGGNLSIGQLQEKLTASSAKTFKSMFSSKRTVAESSGYYVLEVQYNPAKIQIKSKNGDFVEAGVGGEGTNGIIAIQSPNRTTMKVELVFDAVNNQDAFMFEKFTNLSPGAMVSNVSGAVNAIRNKPYSVQPQVDALVATVLQSETKQAVFYWSDMAFAGHIIGVKAKYTMFSPSGHPVRATVELKIRQIGSDPVENKYWDAAYAKLFKAPGLMDKIAGATGNLLNLK